MLAVKAKYENGTVRWERKPPVEGLHDLIVVFADVSASDQDEHPTDEREVWRKVQESVFAKAWDNQDDAVYDNM